MQVNSEVKAYFLGAIRRLYLLIIVAAVFYFGILPVVHWCMTGQHPILESIRVYLAQNLGAIVTAIGSHIAALLSGLGLLFVGFITTRPKWIPKSHQEWYEWVGNAFEAALPGRFRSNGNGNNHDPVQPPEVKQETKP